ncbi:MAG: glycosyltransferase [Candidatus Omnitrophica bacterium]|jgi:glycosyltransferase involved in cell wall biosynthesis|nr:glycosyltransferase [Candidatus Omnitrophota bacterium]
MNNRKNIKISVSIPVYNSSKYLELCLKTIFDQDYPPDLIEVLVVDGGSCDNTLDIARKYKTIILNNSKRLGEYGMRIAIENATGDLVVIFAADNGLVGKNWLKDVAEGFSKYPDLSCVWGKMVAAKQDPMIMRYYELIQSEPLAQFLNRNLDAYLKKASVEIINARNYKIFDVDPCRPLCWGANGIVYRLKDVKHLFLGEKYIGDNEVFQRMVESGKNKVAYSYDLNIYHHTVDSIWHWVKKWKRNYTQIFLETRHERRIDWFYCGNFRLKMFFWLIYSLVPVFSFVHSLYLMIRDRNIYWLFHPLMCFLQTVTYLFWTFALPKGRRSLFEHIFKTNIYEVTNV